MAQTKWISDEIGEGYLSWHGGNCIDAEKNGTADIEGDYIYIKSGTGTGKTYFVFNILAKYARQHGKKILYLTNRNSLKETIEVIVQDESLNDTVDIMNYQRCNGQPFL